MKYGERHGAIHLLKIGQSTESICGIVSVRFKPTKKRTVTCSHCSDIIEHCRFVKVARESAPQEPYKPTAGDKVRLLKWTSPRDGFDPVPRFFGQTVKVSGMYAADYIEFRVNKTVYAWPVSLVARVPS